MDDIVWIREEPPASDNGNHSAANDNTIVVERFSTTLSPQSETVVSPQISSTNAVNCTDQFAQKQFSEPANESQRLNEEKRVSFNIPPPFTNITGTSNAEPPFKRQEGVQYEASSIPNSNQEGFNITLSNLSACESESSDNSIKKLPGHLDQNSLKELGKEAPASQTSHEASTLPSQENLMQSNEQRGFIITVSYPGDSEKKYTDNLSGKQSQHPDQNPPKELEKEALVNGTSSPASTLPAVDSSIKQKLDDKSQEDTKQNNGQKGFDVVISYPSDSEKKSTDNSSEKPQQPDQNPLKELEKEALVNEAPYPGSTSLTADSSIQKQSDDKAPETTKKSNEQGDINKDVSLSNDAFSSDHVHINVDVFGPMITTPPTSIGVIRPTNTFDSTQVKVEKFEPWTTNVPASTGLSALQINAEPAKEQEESKTAQAKLIEDSTGISNHNDIDKNDDGFDISEYERKLYKTTKETKDLVNRLCDTSQKLDQNTRSIANNVAVQRKCLFEDVYKTIEDIEQLPPPPELPTGGLAGNVESVIIGSGVLKYVTGCVVLPNGTVLATDEESGLLLFDIQGNLLKTVANTHWRKPRSPVYHKDHILMLVDIEETKCEWCRYIIKFTINLDYVAKIEGPKWMRKETIVNDRLSIAHTDYIYLSVCGGMFSALYELTPVGQWTELQYRISESYLDMLAFAVVGPITQILVVEGKLGYALQFSVRESEVVDRRRLAICERPGPIARDEAGRLFIVNRASTSIQLVDTVRWAPARNVALTDSLVPHFSASWGLLAVALKGAIRLQRYSFRLGYN